MSSIWTQGPGSPLQKLEGYIKPHDAHVKLAQWAAKLKRANKARVVMTETDEVHLAWPDGHIFTVFIEHYSPPSAPEEGQPKRVTGGAK